MAGKSSAEAERAAKAGKATGNAPKKTLSAKKPAGDGGKAAAGKLVASKAAAGKPAGKVPVAPARAAKKAPPAATPAPAGEAGLKAGALAPAFTLPGAGGETISLDALKGKKVALYFYPKDDTSGCTIEAKEFNELNANFAKAGAVVIGMSPDPVKSHDKFRAKYGLVFPLASDETKETLLAYGVWIEKSMYGRKYLGVERSTFLIDEKGRIARIWRKVSAPGHAAEVLAAVREIPKG